MRFTATLANGDQESQVYYSVGGGAVVDEDMVTRNAPPEGGWDVPYRFSSGAELLDIAEREGIDIADIARANERAAFSDEEINRRLDAIVQAMAACIDRGMAIDGILPGGLNVKRRAPSLHRLLVERAERTLSDPLTVIDWVNLWALAVNEENAAGGKVVTAPTNGAAGIVPAVLRYYQRFTPNPPMTASTSSCSPPRRSARCSRRMPRSRAPRSAVRRGRRRLLDGGGGIDRGARRHAGQVENAAEIGMEHNLGLTCDPVAGLVQVPCIERNAVGAARRSRRRASRWSATARTGSASTR